MTAASAYLQNLHRTGQRITRGIWVCAGLTMAGSALAGMQTFSKLHEPAVMGLATAIAVDVALFVVLTGDRALQGLGLTSGWKGRALRILTAGMSGVLNCAMAALAGNVLLTILHAFLPVLLIGLTEYAQVVSLALRQAIQAHEAEQLAAATPAPSVVVAPAPPAPPPIGGLPEISEGDPPGAHIQGALGVGRAPTTKPAESLEVGPGARTPLGRTRHLSSVPAASGRRSPVRDRALTWLAAQHRRGADLSDITPGALADAIGAKVDTCRRSLPEWRSVVTANSEAAI